VNPPIDLRSDTVTRPTEAMRAAMAQNQIARQTFDQVVHDTIAAAAAKMSDIGRAKLAEWPPTRNNIRTSDGASTN